MHKKALNRKDDEGDYLTIKRAKLSEQFLEEQISLKERPPQIFVGIRVFVNGYTVPPAEELKKMVIQHGGLYSTFLDSGVTHMVATNIPDSKAKLIKKIKVVSPEWILHSLEQGRLLSCSDYLILREQKNRICGVNVERYGSSCSSDQISTCASELDREKSVDKLLVKDIETTPSLATKSNPVSGADINSYYNRSRLHFLSTMKMELKKYISDLQKGNDHTFSGLEKLRSRMKYKKGDDCLNFFQGLSTNDENESSRRVIIHIDMDCFFVSVSRCGRPDLDGIPIVVTSSKILNNGTHNFESKDSMADIACCSYEARAAGIRNGMRVGQALQLCSNLVAVPYEFEKYRTVSRAMYDVAASYTLDLEAVSCDEMYIDCTSVLKEINCSPIDFAEHIRQEIKEKTGCSASAGIGANHIQARLATRKAKPDGVFYLSPDLVETFMKEVLLKDLPGVGPSINSRLRELNLFTCEQLYNYGLSNLQKEFGHATGKSLYMHCQGLESLKEEINSLQRKSVSSEINYGIRFTHFSEAEETLINLSKIVSSKMEQLEGKSITLKLKVRSPDAPVDSAKFLGHGICDNISRTSSISVPTSDPNIISKIAIDLLKKTKVLTSEIRGIGLMINKLSESSLKKKNDIITQMFKKNKNVKEQPFQGKTKSTGCSAEDNLEQSIVPVKSKSVGHILEDKIPRKTTATITKNKRISNEGSHRWKEIPSKTSHEKGFSGCDPVLERLLSVESDVEMNLINCINKIFKSFLNAGKLPEKTFKNEIIYILLNEISQLNFSSVIFSIKELNRLSKRNISNPVALKKWTDAIEEIKEQVYKNISEIIGYSVN